MEGAASFGSIEYVSFAVMSLISSVTQSRSIHNVSRDGGEYFELTGKLSSYIPDFCRAVVVFEDKNRLQLGTNCALSCKVKMSERSESK